MWSEFLVFLPEYTWPSSWLIHYIASLLIVSECLYFLLMLLLEEILEIALSSPFMISFVGYTVLDLLRIFSISFYLSYYFPLPCHLLHLTQIVISFHNAVPSGLLKLACSMTKWQKYFLYSFFLIENFVLLFVTINLIVFDLVFQSEYYP
jgi:hypothetical protein